MFVAISVDIVRAVSSRRLWMYRLGNSPRSRMFYWCFSLVALALFPCRGIDGVTRCWAACTLCVRYQPVLSFLLHLVFCFCFLHRSIDIFLSICSGTPVIKVRAVYSLVFTTGYRAATIPPTPSNHPSLHPSIRQSWFPFISISPCPSCPGIHIPLIR